MTCRAFGTLGVSTLSGAMLCCFSACGQSQPSVPNSYLVYTSRATGTVTHQLRGETETWEVGAEGDGTPCVFVHELIADIGIFVVECDLFYFSVTSEEVMLDSDHEVSAEPLLVDGATVPIMTARITITESVGAISYATHTVPASYLRRYTVSGVLDCDADPELGCEGTWSLDLVGEQTNADTYFMAGEPN